MIGLCYLGQERFHVDFFYFGRNSKTGLLPMSACVDAFERSDIALVQMEANPPVPGQVAAALLRRTD